MSLIFLHCALKRKFLFALAILFIADHVDAQTATMRMNSDLLIHPTQVANVFALNADRINKASVWNWNELRFQTPYKTQWQGVTAKGPFSLNIHTDKLNAQEMWFEFYWAEPIINVEQFVIHDQVVRDYGGVQVIINLDGSCSGMDWKVANGFYKVRGKLTWGIVNQDITVQWKEFEFQSNPAGAASVTNLGQCVGPQEIQQALRENIASVTSDAGTMEALLRRGILSFLNNSLQSFKAELMKVRTGSMGSNLELTWEPTVMVTLPGGMIRVPGYVHLKKHGVAGIPLIVDRTLPETEFQTATESGFIMPKSAFDNVASFLFSTGDLMHRYKSTEIKGFQDLMQSRSNQSYVWPDLQKFSMSALFYFDLQAAAAPSLQDPANGTAKNGGGVVYEAKAPIAINQLAPAGNRYLNYVDFTSTVNGLFRASVKSQNLVMQLQTSKVPLSAKFRPEFKTYRKVDETIDTARLGTAGRDFINGKTYTMELPKWNMGPNMNMIYGDLKMFKESIILPLTIK